MMSGLLSLAGVLNHKFIFKNDEWKLYTEMPRKAKKFFLLHERQ